MKKIMPKWISPWRLRVAIALGVVASVGLTIAGLSLAGSGPVNPASTTGSTGIPLPTSSQVDLIRQRVLAAAQENGDPQPTNGVLVASTTFHDFMQSFAGEDVPGAQDVYAIGLQGTFSHPIPSPSETSGNATGNFMLIVVDAKALQAGNFEVLNFTLQKVPVDISGLGNSEPLDLNTGTAGS